MKQVLQEVAESIEERWQDYGVAVWTHAYEEDAIYYYVLYRFDQWNWVPAVDKFNTRLYYAVQRHGLTIARRIEYRADVQDLKPKYEIHQRASLLRANPLFEPLEGEVIHRLAASATEHHYSEGEKIVRQGEQDEGFYVIQAGEVTISVTDEAGSSQDMLHLKAGDFFGELALLKSEPSPVSALAVTDVHLIIIEGGLITQLIDTNPQFAQEVNFFIEKRQTLVNAISRTENGKQNHTARQDWINVAKRL